MRQRIVLLGVIAALLLGPLETAVQADIAPPCDVILGEQEVTCNGGVNDPLLPGPWNPLGLRISGTQPMATHLCASHPYGVGLLPAVHYGPVTIDRTVQYGAVAECVHPLTSGQVVSVRASLYWLQVEWDPPSVSWVLKRTCTSFTGTPPVNGANNAAATTCLLAFGPDLAAGTYLVEGVGCIEGPYGSGCRTNFDIFEAV